MAKNLEGPGGVSLVIYRAIMKLWRDKHSKMKQKYQAVISVSKISEVDTGMSSTW